MQTAALPALASQSRVSLLASMADRYGMDPKAFEITVRSQVMPAHHSNEEFAACMLVANQYKLNPFTKEVYFMKTRGGTIQPIVSVDGWVKQANEHPQYDGVDFVDTFTNGKIECVTCKLYRKDRSRPVIVTEYLSECDTSSPAWKKTPARMLRHRAFMQAIRYAFGFSGVMDRDEFDQWQGTPAAVQPAREIIVDEPEAKSAPAVLDPFADDKPAAVETPVEPTVDAEPVQAEAQQEPLPLLDPFGTPDKAEAAPEAVTEPEENVEAIDPAAAEKKVAELTERIKAATTAEALDKAQAWIEEREEHFNRTQRDGLYDLIADRLLALDAALPA